MKIIIEPWTAAHLQISLKSTESADTEAPAHESVNDGAEKVRKCEKKKSLYVWKDEKGKAEMTTLHFDGALCINETKMQTWLHESSRSFYDGQSRKELTFKDVMEALFEQVGNETMQFSFMA